MPDISFSLYANKEAYVNEELSIDNYIGYVKNGYNQDLVIRARLALQRGNEAEYKKLKNSSRAITGSCVIESGKKKDATNIKAMNGIIVIDIDTEISEEKYYELRSDKYTLVIHRSFGGNGVCIFVKIDPAKFNDSFLGLSEYYAITHDVTVDPSCSNPNRLRYLSYDPEIFYNPKSAKFVPKDVKRFKEIPAKDVNYIFHEDDFDNILAQIRDKSIDLCQEDYFRYMRIGMALASKFGADGLEKFKFVCSFGAKYNEKNTVRDYTGFVKRHKGQNSIGTFYYYCKQANIQVYSEKTRTIINRVKVGKSQGKPTVSSIASNLKVANAIEVTPADLRLIGELIESKQDFSKEANQDVSEIEQLQQFILDTYSPAIDVITNIRYVNDGIQLTTTETNDIYINCKKNFDFNVNISDIRSVLNSNSINKINILNDFIRDNAGDYSGYIDDYISCIEPCTEYTKWAFKHWLVGGLHNWTAAHNEKIVCPLTLVICGQEHGIGKTSFLRNIMPPALERYIVEAKIDGTNKDSLYTLSNTLLLIDDEFGGQAFKDVKSYKAISDMNIITQRRPYEPEPKTFKRRGLLGGTSNDMNILKDVTGNRRILPINATYIDYDRLMKIDKVGLIMEAYALLKSGFDWIIRTQEDMQYIKDNTSENEVVLPIEEIFFNHFKLEPGGLFMKEVILNRGEILEYLNQKSIMKPTKYDLDEIIVKNKLSYKVHRIDENVKKGIKLYKMYDSGHDEVPF